jgi:hypothetical protein
MTLKSDAVIALLKQDKTLRNKLNYAIDDIFIAAQLSKLSILDKRDFLEKLKDLLIEDKNYDNIHVHWT